MTKRRVRSRNGKEEKRNSNSTVAVDRISKLPDPVIYHILSFVPTVDAVRMSLLSRRWRRMWYSVPKLQFSDSYGFHKLNSFDMFVEKCLMYRNTAMRYIADSVVPSLRLDIQYFRGRQPNLGRYLGSAIVRNNVKELDICCKRGPTCCSNYRNYMPFMAVNGRSLTTVKLEGVKLIRYYSVNLPSLKSLYLRDVTIIADNLLNLLNSCPSLEKLVLKDDSNFPHYLEILSSSLKFLEIGSECRELRVEALNLESLVVYDSGNCCRVDFCSCPAIRDLSLLNMCTDAGYQNYDEQISELTCLENLTMEICEIVSHINIPSPTLKCFSLRNMKSLELKVTTETPNLVSFKYKGYAEFSLTMKTMNPQFDGEFNFIKSMEEWHANWYTELVTSLSNIDSSLNTVSLYALGDKALVIVPENLRKTFHPPWPNLKNLKVWILGNLASKSVVRKALQWLSLRSKAYRLRKVR